MTQQTPQTPPEPEFPPIEELAPAAPVATPAEPAGPLPEAGGIAWVDLYTPKGAKISVTARSHGPKEAIAELVEAIIWAQGTYGLDTVRPGSPPVTPAAQVAANAGNAPLAAAIQAQGEAVAPSPNGQPWLTMDIDRIIIKAEPGNVYTLEVYAPGHQWPDMKASKRKPEVIAGLLKHVTSADPTTPAEYHVNAVAYYLEGKPKANGGHWLDLYHLRLAA